MKMTKAILGILALIIVAIVIFLPLYVDLFKEVLFQEWEERLRKNKRIEGGKNGKNTRS